MLFGNIEYDVEILNCIISIKLSQMWNELVKLKFSWKWINFIVNL